MKVIEKLRKATGEIVDAMKWPSRERIIKRAFEAVIDATEVEKDRMESKVIDLEKSLTTVKSDDEARGIIKKIGEAVLDYEAAKDVARVVAECQDHLNSEAKE
jgi:hypothetical protein